MNQLFYSQLDCDTESRHNFVVLMLKLCSSRWTAAVYSQQQNWINRGIEDMSRSCNTDLETYLFTVIRKTKITQKRMRIIEFTTNCSIIISLAKVCTWDRYPRDSRPLTHRSTRLLVTNTQYHHCWIMTFCNCHKHMIQRQHRRNEPRQASWTKKWNAYQ